MFATGAGVGTGAWLEAHRYEIDRGEAPWLLALADFDVNAGWAGDGQLSCVEWLRWKLHMCRSTAYEKTHLAGQLRARPALAAALAESRISYSAARVIARMDDPGPDTDATVIAFAENHSVRQVEQLVAHQMALADQERPPPDPDVRRGVRRRPVGDGWGRLEVTLPDVELDELEAALAAFVAVNRRPSKTADWSARADDTTIGPFDDPAEPSAHADDSTGGSGAGGDRSAQADDGTGRSDSEGGRSAHADDRVGRPDDQVDRSARADDDRVGPFEGPDDPDDQAAWPQPDPDLSARADDGSGPVDPETRRQAWRASRADAMVDLARTALAHADDGHAAGDDRYLVHLVARTGTITRIDGTPLHPDTAATICCDTSTVVHTVDGHGEPLQQGRKTREWNTAQRRAVMVRDGGHCRFVGCERRVVDIHHRVPWEDGGHTDIDNAMAACRSHHRLLHHGYTTSRDTDGTIHFYRPDHTHLGATTPTGPDQQHLIAA